ncbi:MAG: MBOAT family protein [Alphaproteobacteria bacterium]|nr:MBOAT family protein [Alphaproteobacteria bacterium]
MVFSSAIFVMVFLPLFLLAYYLTPKRYHSLIILLASYGFYGWWRVDFMALFAGVTLFNYVISLFIIRHDSHSGKIMAIGVIGNLLTLGYFKYFNFGVNSLNLLLGHTGAGEITAWTVILPIGISFYIFQSISYLIDVHRGDARPADSFMDFAAFISLFPQLIAGPVLRYKDVADQFRDRVHSWGKFNEGAIRFAMGFCKKIFIADTLAPIADTAFALHDPSFMDSWVGVLAYTAQLYFDFSGYSDMAVGLGLMMGFRFIENFNHPYISRSITEFWRRWHISLSTWLRDYLYIPLGGNRKGKRRTYINLFLTMVLGGLWHGANWTFVLWGAWHGGIMAVERAFGAKKDTPYPKLIALPLTFLMILSGWVLFRATTVSGAFDIYAGMVGLQGMALSDELVWSITNLQIVTLLIAGVIIFAPIFSRAKYAEAPPVVGEERSWAYGLSPARQIIVCALFTLGLCKLIAQSFSPFLYFQF